MLLEGPCKGGRKLKIYFSLDSVTFRSRLTYEKETWICDEDIEYMYTLRWY